MDPKATNDDGQEDTGRASPAPGVPTLKTTSGPAEMSKTLAGVGESMSSPHAKDIDFTHPIPPSSVDDNASEYNSALSCSQFSTLSGGSSITSTFASPPLSISELTLEPPSFVNADFGPYFGSLRDRYPARVDTWPILSSATFNFPHRSFFGTANAAMACANKGSKRSEDRRRPTLLPVRWNPPSLLSQELPIAHDPNFQGIIDKDSDEDGHLTINRPPPPAPHQPKLSSWLNLNQGEGETVVISESIVTQTSEDVRSRHHAPSSPSRSPGEESINSENGDSAQVHDEKDELAKDEEQEDPYNKLATAMRNLIMMSTYGSDLEEFSVPIDDYIFTCLEQILNRGQAKKDATALNPDLNELAWGSPSEGYISIPNGLSSSDKGHGSRKRKNEDEHARRGYEDNDGGADGDGNEPGDSLRAKQHGNAQQTGKLSCPFRKKNPIYFNVRDHPQCANQSYANLSLLKRHITTSDSHNTKRRGTEQCPRCKRWFNTRGERDQHLMQEAASMCAVEEDRASHDEKDGISPETCKILTDRKMKTRIDTWDKLWQVLFPLEPLCPSSSFDPPVELDEVENIFIDVENVKSFHNRLDQSSLSSISHDFLYNVQEYIIDNLKRCRELRSHGKSEKRDNTIRLFLDHVRMIQPPAYIARTQPYDQCHPHSPCERGCNACCNIVSNISDESSHVGTVISSSEGEVQPSSKSSTSHTRNSLEGRKTYPDPLTMSQPTHCDIGAEQYGSSTNREDWTAAISASEYLAGQNLESQSNICCFCRGQGCPTGCKSGIPKAHGNGAVSSIKHVNNVFPSNFNVMSPFINNEGVDIPNYENDFGYNFNDEPAPEQPWDESRR